MVLLERDQRALHVGTIDTIHFDGLVTDCPITVGHQGALHGGDSLAGFAQAHDAVVDDGPRLDADAMLGLYGKSSTRQVCNVVLELLVVAGVHFQVDVVSRTRA